MILIVKSFIESLKPLCGKQDNPNVGFMVQGGLPEVYYAKFGNAEMEKLLADFCVYTKYFLT